MFFELINYEEESTKQQEKKSSVNSKRSLNMIHQFNKKKRIQFTLFNILYYSIIKCKIKMFKTKKIFILK